MLVVMDVGNTNITIGIYNGNKLIGNYRLTTKMKRMILMRMMNP